MPTEFKVCDRGAWIYKEREFRLEVEKDPEPHHLELLLALLDSIIKQNLVLGYLKQISGCLNIEGRLLSLKMHFDSQESENTTYNYSLLTKFSSYQDSLLLNTLTENTSGSLFKSLKSRQIIRQVGIVVGTLEIGFKLYSAKSYFSKWFKVPIEEASIFIGISDSKLQCHVRLRKSSEDKNIALVRRVLTLVAEIAGVTSEKLEPYWELGKRLI